jgi:putative addiction module CopG family antidote
MNIALPPHIQRFVEEEVESGRYEDAQQVIVTALEWMADDRRIPPDVLAELIAEPLAQIERGEGQRWTPELRKKIKEDAIRNAERGHKVRDEIKY